MLGSSKLSYPISGGRLALAKISIFKIDMNNAEIRCSRNCEMFKLKLVTNHIYHLNCPEVNVSSQLRNPERFRELYKDLEVIGLKLDFYLIVSIFELLRKEQFP